MIKLKLNFGAEGKDVHDIEIVDGEVLYGAVGRSLLDVPLNGRDAGEVFQAVVNGHIIERDFWAFTKLKSSDQVVISPLIKGGDSGQTFKQIAILAIAVFASAVVGPWAGGSIYGALAATAVTIAGTLLLNALIPPPVPGNGELALNGGLESSQMYSITSQSNAIRRFEVVPKVYGTHRVFPNVAATPYTTLQADETGEVIQYLVVLYDFGLGPAYVSNLAIGDTPLNGANFSDYQYNFVDVNKPAVSEGVWDDQLKSELTLYRGDAEGDGVAVALNGNENENAPQAEREAIRNTAPNTVGDAQEIILNFVNPEGLYGFNAQGVKGPREVNLRIDFSKVGEDNWHSYNDPNYVSSFENAGGIVSRFTIREPGPNGDAYFEVGYEGFKGEGSVNYPNLPNNIKSGYFRELYLRPNNGFAVGFNDTGTLLPLLADDKYYAIAQRQRIQFYYDNIYLGTVTPGPEGGPDIGGGYRAQLLYSSGGGSFMRAPPGLLSFVYYFNLDTSQWVLVDAPINYRLRNNPGEGGGFVITADKTSPFYSTVRFVPREQGQFKVRVTRVSTRAGLLGYNDPKSDKLVWQSITTRFDRNPINTDKRHVFLELRIRATSQLNGTISNLSGIVTSALEVYNGNTGVWQRELTNNPAWVVTDLLIGEVNKKAIGKERLHLPSLVEWADFCDAIPIPPFGKQYVDKRFTTNFVLDYAATLQTVLSQVMGSAQASLNIVDGKYGALIDRYKATPVQIFTPRNSRDFNSVRAYNVRPDGLTVKYIDPSADWEVRETIAFDDGFNDSNYENLEELVAFACTSDEQAWRFGRYMIAQNKLRQETISLLVDFEHLVCTRGDFVQITQDVMRAGGVPARVKAVAGTIVTINDALEIQPDIEYGYVVRASDGQIKTSTCTPVTPRSFELEGYIPEPGDLIIVGEVGKVVYDCIVKSITPNDDLSANLVLIEKADAIYNYESSGDLPDYDPQISRTSDPDAAPPAKVENLLIADEGYICAGAAFQHYIDIVWDIPDGSVYAYSSIMLDTGAGYREVAQTDLTTYHYLVDPANLGVVHNFKIIGVSASGKKINLGEADLLTTTPLRKTDPPSDVEKMSIDITNEVLQLTWTRIPDCGAMEYWLRYSPVIDGEWPASTPLVKVNAQTSSVAVQARTGTYFIKAVDFNGNQSMNAAAAITTIPNLFNLNVIESITDSPNFNGGFDRVEKIGNSVILDHKTVGGIDTSEYYSDGYYYYTNLLDLGDIYTVRLQSSIQAEGISDGDIIETWTTLDSVLQLSAGGPADWDVETQYRTTEEFNVIENWTTLSSILALNEGSPDNFSEWRPFTMTDGTGRVFQFRLRLISNKPSVSPRVYDATIRADMPDRTDSFENLISDADEGLAVVYAPAFKGPGTTPNVQVSIDGAQSGDYWTFDYRTLEGLKIRFFDKNDNPVSRQFDLALKGYGRKAMSII